MSQTPDRDGNGRFVKPPGPEHRPDQTNIHPVGKLLFGWTDSPRTPFVLLLIVIVLVGGMTLVDVLHQRHEYVEEANMTGFYALWGFGAFAIAVLSGWPLARLLRRSEDYYGEAETTPDDIEEKQ